MELMDTPFILLLDALAPARAQLARQLPACRALHAENCEEALTFLHTCPVSLVLADCTRPASQGPQLLARMQLEPALSAIPVLALVSLENETAVEQAYSLGRVRYHRGTGAAGGTLPPGAQHFARTAAIPPRRTGAPVAARPVGCHGALFMPARYPPGPGAYGAAQGVYPVPNWARSGCSIRCA